MNTKLIITAIVLALATITAASAATFRMVSYGPADNLVDAFLPSASTSVYYTEQGWGRYGVTVDNGNIWGGYAARSSNGAINSFGFSYDHQYGVTGMSVNNGFARGSVYQGTNGLYGGNMNFGSNTMDSYVPYGGRYGSVYPISYVGNSLY